jgi:hypothetical protein
MSMSLFEMKRRPGRPRGYPKTGGRQRDVPPQTSAEMRERIIRQADPVGFLIAVAAGRVVETYDPVKRRKVQHAPTFEQRLEAAGKLVRKVLPDLNATSLDASIDIEARQMIAVGELNPVEREQRLLAIREALSAEAEQLVERALQTLRTPKPTVEVVDLQEVCLVSDRSELASVLILKLFPSCFVGWQRPEFWCRSAGCWRGWRRPTGSSGTAWGPG